MEIGSEGAGRGAWGMEVPDGGARFWSGSMDRTGDASAHLLECVHAARARCTRHTATGSGVSGDGKKHRHVHE